jgi:hypothetical protein
VTASRPATRCSCGCGAFGRLRVFLQFLILGMPADERGTASWPAICCVAIACVIAKRSALHSVQQQHVSQAA